MQGGDELTLKLLRFHLCITYKSLNVWVRFFVWYLWNSTHKKKHLTLTLKDKILYTVEILRALKLHQAIIWTHVDLSSVKSSAIHMRVILTGNAQDINHKNTLQNYSIIIFAISHRGQWVKYNFLLFTDLLIIVSADIFKKAMEKASSGKGLGQKSGKVKIESAVVVSTCTACSLYLSAIQTLSQLRLDILAGN